MMWMMGYNDGAEFDSILDPYTGRKLRPLVPRPAAASSPTAASLNPTNGADLFTLNHRLAMASEQNKRLELTNTQQLVVSSRWNPTPEQLQTLEELYLSGTRTPSAEQIQHITTQLRKYGKVEGKNVFYWFQNHKARERQKRRRQQLESLSDEPQITHAANHFGQIEERKELPPGPNKTAFEVEQTKNWASSTNSSTLAEKTVCTQGAAAAVAAGEAECKAAADGGRGGWAQLDIEGAELLQQQRNATWQMMNLSCSSSPSPTNHHHHFIMASSSSASSSALTVTSPATTVVPSPIAFTAASNQDQLHHFVNIFSKPFIPAAAQINPDDHSHEEQDSQTTLQLFPLESSRRRSFVDWEEEEEEEDEDVQIAMDIGGDHQHHVPAAPYQFFEFLPLKN